MVLIKNLWSVKKKLDVVYLHVVYFKFNVKNETQTNVLLCTRITVVRNWIELFCREMELWQYSQNRPMLPLGIWPQYNHRSQCNYWAPLETSCRNPGLYCRYSTQRTLRYPDHCHQSKTHTGTNYQNTEL